MFKTCVNSVLQNGYKLVVVNNFKNAVIFVGKTCEIFDKFVSNFKQAFYCNFNLLLVGFYPFYTGINKDNKIFKRTNY